MNVPKLRFKEFNGEYNNVCLNTLSKKITNKNKDNIIKNVISNSAIYGLISQRDFFDKDIANNDNTNNYFIIEKGDFVYNPRKSNEAPYGPINLYKFDEKGVISPLYLCFKTSQINNNYLEYYFKSSFWHRYIYLNGDSGARHDRVSIKDDIFFEMKINIPNESEQLKVANFLSLLDKKIELQTKKIEDLKLFKLCIKKKLFSKLNKYALIQIEKLLNFEQPSKYIVESEEYINDCCAIPVLTANKAFILGYCKEDNFYNKGNCIIFDDFTMDMKYVTFPFKIKSSAIKILTSKENVDLKYIYEYLTYLNLHSEEHKRHYISMVQKIYISNPEYNVQRNISLKLTCIDNLLLLENSKLEKLIKLKKGLMQNMFV